MTATQTSTAGLAKGDGSRSDALPPERAEEYRARLLQGPVGQGRPQPGPENSSTLISRSAARSALCSLAIQQFSDYVTLADPSPGRLHLRHPGAGGGRQSGIGQAPLPWHPPAQDAVRRAADQCPRLVVRRADLHVRRKTAGARLVGARVMSTACARGSIRHGRSGSASTLFKRNPERIQDG